MNQREAKRRACFEAATTLEALCRDDWHVVINREYGEENGERVLVGIDELVSELWRRAGADPASQQVHDLQEVLW